MAETSSNRKFDSLDFFLGVMALLTIVALFFLFHSWTKYGQLQKSVARADDTLENIRAVASRKTNDPRQVKDGPPKDNYFGTEIPSRLSGRARPRNVQTRSPSPSNDEGWILYSWLVNWDRIDRQDLANFIRQAEAEWPGVRASGLDLREPEPEDPQRNAWKATATFTYYDRKPD